MTTQSFGEYQIFEDIGRGATSRVVRASKGTTQYAIKIFDLFTSRLDFDHHRQEYAILQKLNHPNIVKVHEFGKLNDHSYIVMDLVVGENLADLVRRRGPLEVAHVKTVARDIAGALQHARSNSIVHGDVKPSNVLVDEDGHARLGDFGLARISPPLEHMTPVRDRQTSLGTTDFMAPEVLNDGSPTWSSDLYSFGVVIYFAITAHLPSEGRTIFSRARDRVEGKLVPLSVRNPLVPPRFAEAVHRALSIDPKNRFDSCEEFYAALAVPDMSGSKADDKEIILLKPSFFGMGVDLKALWKKAKRKLKKDGDAQPPI